MSRQLAYVAILLLAAPHSFAESWFDSAMDFLGFGSEETEQKTMQESVTDQDESASGRMTSLSSQIADRLGVTEEQAKGGLGTLFSLVQTTLASTDFSKLSSGVPEMDGLLAAVPALSESASGLSSALGSTGKYGAILQGASATYSRFKTLGLGVQQIPQYIDVTNEFLESQGGKDVADLFKEGIESLM